MRHIIEPYEDPTDHRKQPRPKPSEDPASDDKRLKKNKKEPPRKPSKKLPPKPERLEILEPVFLSNFMHIFDPPTWRRTVEAKYPEWRASAPTMNGDRKELLARFMETTGIKERVVAGLLFHLQNSGADLGNFVTAASELRKTLRYDATIGEESSNQARQAYDKDQQGWYDNG